MEKTSNNKPRSVSNTVLGVQEFLVLVEYLFRCTDKNHQTSQKEINEYLIDKYGFDIRRDRINDIYEALYQFCKTNKDFGVNIVKEMHGRCARYYLESRSLSNEDLVAIGSSMRNDKYLSTLNADKYIDLLVKQFACKYQEEEIKKQIEDADKEIVKLSKLEEENLKKLSVPEAHKYLFYINTTSNFVEPTPVEKPVKVSCYLYDIVESNYQIMAYFINIKSSKLFSVPLSRFTIKEHPVYMGSDMPDLEKIFSDSQNRTIKEYVKEAGVVLGGHISNISFEISPNAIEYIAESYHKFFKKELPYKSKEYVSRNMDEREIVRKNYSVNIKSDAKSFLRWIEDDFILRNISNIKPSFIVRNLAFKYASAIKRLSNQNMIFETNMKIYKREKDGNRSLWYDEVEERKVFRECQTKLRKHPLGYKFLYRESKLADYFKKQRANELTLTFEDMQRIVKIPMPKELSSLKDCWVEELRINSRIKIPTPWESGGYSIKELNLEKGKITFIKKKRNDNNRI